VVWRVIHNKAFKRKCIPLIMTTPYIIGACREHQLDAVRSLARVGFHVGFTEKGLQGVLKDLEEIQARGHLLVATMEDTPVGFAGYDFLRDDLETKEDYIQRQLDYSRHRDQKEWLREERREIQEMYGCGEVLVEYFENPFTVTEDINTRDEDMVLTHLVINPLFQRKGIGQALTEARINIAREEHASVVYVNCWDRGSISRLYEKLKFHSIIRLGPGYCDGSPLRMLGLSL